MAATPSSSADGQTLNTTCPGGRQLTGVGADISGGFGQVGIEAIRPYLTGSPPTGLEVIASEDRDGTTGNWSLRSYLICATPLSGLTLVSASSGVPSSEANKLATAVCPSGKSVVGAGARVTLASGEEVLPSYIRPNPGLQSVDAFAFEDEDGSASDWTVQVHAICANPPPGLQLVSAFSDLDSDEISSATASCPAGKYVLGAGGGLQGINGEGILDDLRPDATLTRVTVTGIEDESGFSGDWNVQASAICATR